MHDGGDGRDDGHPLPRSWLQVNQMLPIGGPGRAYNAKQQADLLFQVRRTLARPQDSQHNHSCMQTADSTVGLHDYVYMTPMGPLT